MKPAALLMVAAFALAGCGGSTSESSATGGTLRLRIEWPERDRLVPVASKSVVVTAIVVNGEGDLAVEKKVDQKIVPRPETGQLSNVEMKLPSTKIIIQVDASPLEDGSGNIQATARKEVSIPESQTLPISITMVTRIKSVRLTPDPEATTLILGRSKTFTATAESDPDIIVVTSPSKWTWTTSDPSTLSIEPQGDTVKVNALKKGSVTLTATEEESHRTKSVTIRIQEEELTVELPEGEYVGFLTYDFGIGTRREKEKLQILPGYGMSYWGWTGEGPDGYRLIAVGGYTAKRQPDGSIMFEGSGITDDYGLDRGDEFRITGSYFQGQMTVNVGFYRNGVLGRWFSSGALGG
jgi:hypothetical protein